MELSPVGLLLVLILCSYSGHTAAWQENPKAVLVLDRDQTQFYTGESVTLRCSIEGQDTSGWKFVWQRDGRYNYPQQGWSDKNEYIPLDVSDGVEYKCHGVNDKEYSEWSKRVKLQVSALPTPTVTIEPESSVYVGERVTLKCEIQSESDWTYKWFKGSNSDHLSQPDTSTLTITAAAKSDESHYWCQGEMRGRAVSSLMSGHVYLFVKELPLATLTVEPQSPVFTGENVTLKCVIESLSGWTYKWYKESSRTPVSEGNTFTIRGAAESHKGQYWCQGERRDRPTSSQPSRRTTLDVKDSKPKLTLSPGHQLLTGDSVNLRCELGVSSGLVFYWYRDTQTSDPVAQTDGNSYSISSVKVSDGGQYWCRAGRGDPVFYTQYSDAAEIKVTDAGSSTLVVAVGVVIGLLVAFALVVSLVLMYRSQKDKSSVSVTPNPGPQQSSSHSPTSQNRVLVGAVAGTGDVVYAEIELKNTDKKKKEAKRGASMSDTLYSLLRPVKSPVSDGVGDGSSDVTYAKVKPKKHRKQDSAGPSDVTYADVPIKMKSLGSRANQPQEHLYSAVKPGCS
ncbi:Fc receptor-like protein 2 [Alosa pseudoharengus]|uniref:Fc receptor-like protein 2 n=1 Tax=Alosa pseudoharengus TaxID=34774 RepID=UPI003F8B1036